MGDAEKHLAKACKHMAKFVGKHDPFPTKFPRSRDPYRALIRAVVFREADGRERLAVLWSARFAAEGSPVAQHAG